MRGMFRQRNMAPAATREQPNLPDCVMPIVVNSRNHPKRGSHFMVLNAKKLLLLERVCVTKEYRSPINKFPEASKKSTNPKSSGHRKMDAAKGRNVLHYCKSYLEFHADEDRAGCKGRQGRPMFRCPCLSRPRKISCEESLNKAILCIRG